MYGKPVILSEPLPVSVVKAVYDLWPLPSMAGGGHQVILKFDLTWEECEDGSKQFGIVARPFPKSNGDINTYDLVMSRHPLNRDPEFAQFGVVVGREVFWADYAPAVGTGLVDNTLSSYIHSANPYVQEALQMLARGLEVNALTHPRTKAMYTAIKSRWRLTPEQLAERTFS